MQDDIKKHVIQFNDNVLIIQKVFLNHIET